MQAQTLRETWAAVRAEAEQTLARLREFDPDEPRDESGKWTEGGGGDGGGGDKLLLVSERPNEEKLDRWLAQLDARQKELEDQGQAGNREDANLGRMHAALSMYRQEPDKNLDAGISGLNTVYDGDGHLLAAAFTSITGQAPNLKATIHYLGATHHGAHVKLLGQVEKAFGDKVGQIEATEWKDDQESIARYEEAGFKRAGPAEGIGGVVGLVKTTAGAKQLSAQHSALVQGAGKAAAQLLGYDPELLDVSSEDHQFTLGDGQVRHAAGLAYLQTGKIVLFPAQIAGAKHAVGVTSHEVAHQKYQAVVKAVQAEREAVMKDPETLQGMNADGSLKPPLDAKYPLYSRFVKHDNSLDRRIKSDGITPYSKDWWKAAQPGAPQQVSLASAQHETIAEMARRETETGKLEGKPVWRAYYRDIMKTYDELHPKK